MTEEALFHAALELDGAARRAYLDAACKGDDALRRRVEALLAAFAAGRDKLEPPLEVTVDHRGTDRKGRVIAGRYELIEPIGEGGMGAVWVARQTEPVVRKVAVKLIKPGMDSKQVVARFEAERQALALMDHPNIARVLDGGLTDDGRPYFVMELINGLPLTKYCDEAKLTARERLELFVPVCQAVQHAHQKGVIHRDLKPANVLVTLYDGKPVPKVIDFGVAKALGGKLTGETDLTQFGAVVGTLEYMAPEQAGFSAIDVDTRADVYALGVVLYELLTGLRPFDGKRLRAAALDEAVRILREEEPPKPSTRVSTDASAPALAQARRTDAKGLSRLMRGELDWVVMKCLEKDRTRRYETANGLGRDIQRYLADEPVEARLPSAGYRLRKLLRRNKKAVLAAGAFALLLVAATVLSVGLAMWAERERKDAVVARERESEEREEAERQKKRAEGSEEEARRSEAKAQHSLYVANMNRVRFEMEHNNVARGRELLELYRGSDLRGWEWYYWDRALQGELRKIEAHSSWVTCLAFSPDGALLASSNDFREPSIKLWQTATGALVRALPLPPKTPISTIAFHPNGRTLASRHGTGVTFWDVTTGRELRSLSPEGKGTFGPVAFSPDWGTLAVSVTQGRDRSIRLYDLSRQRWGAAMPQTTGTTRLEFSRDGKRLAQMHPEGVNLWDIARGAVVHAISAHQIRDYNTPTQVRFVTADIAFSPDGRTLATCGQDGSARLYDTSTGRTTHAVTAVAGMSALAFTTDGKFLITGGSNGSLTAWEVGTMRKARSFLGPSSNIQRVAVSPEGTRLASGDQSGAIQIWDATAGPTDLLAFGRETERLVKFSPDGKRMSNQYLRGVQVLDPARGRSDWLLVHRGYDESVASGSGVTSFAFSPDGRTLATSQVRVDQKSRQRRDAIRIWGLTDGRVARTFQAPPGHTDQLAFSPDGKTLAFRTRKLGKGRLGASHIRLWEVETGKEQQTFEGLGMAFSPDGKTLAVVRTDRALALFDRDGRDLRTMRGRNGPTVSFSREGERLIFGGSVWEPSSGRELCRLEGDDPVAYFSPDGRRLFSTSPTPHGRAILRVWEARTGSLLLAVDVAGHALAIHPDGWQIAFPSSDMTTWLLDAQPLDADRRRRHEAQNLVAHLFHRPMIKREVLAFLREVKTISEPVRLEALALAERQEQDPELLNTKSTYVTIHSDRTPAEYRDALKWAEEAHRLEPEAGPIANTYGVALYYAGRYEEAITALERSRQLNLRAKQANHYVYDLLFLAMAQWKAGRQVDAKATLQQARDPKLLAGWVLPRHWREAEELIEGKKP